MGDSSRPPDIDRALQQLARDIVPRLDGNALKRSALDACLDAVHADARVSEAADRMLADAEIWVIDDVPAKPRASVPRTTATVRKVAVASRAGRPQPSDPVEVARKRLELDRGVDPRRLHKILLTAEEEVGLALLARPDGTPLSKGGIKKLRGEQREAAEAMVLHNLRLVHSVAKGYRAHGMEYDDLVQAGMTGLTRAVELFDPAAGFKFSTYATWWLRQAITRTLANESRLIRLPVHMWELVRKVDRMRDELTVDGRPPHIRELARACGISVESAIECRRLAPNVVSLDTPLGEDLFTLGDLVESADEAPEHIEVHGLFPEDLEPLLATLSEREAEVLRMRGPLAPYNDKMTLDDVGQVYGVTRERIRQIEAKAMKRLRTLLRSQGYPVPRHLTDRKISSAASPPEAA